MDVKRLKEILETMDDNLEVFIRNSFNIIGNIIALDQIELSSYGSFGRSIPCLILNTGISKEIELDEDGNYIDFIVDKH